MSSSPYQNRLHQALARAMAEEQRNPRRSSTPLNGDAPPSPQSPSAPTSASPGASQGGRRVQIKIKINKSPLKGGSRGLSDSDDVPQVKFIPGPNSNAPRDYDDLPESEKMAEYIKENKALLAELVAFESEGYTARINFDDPAAPRHDPVMFEEEPEEDQKALNDVLHENYCLRLRCQCIKLAKTQGWEKLWPNGTEVPMKMYGKYMFIVTFP